MEKGLTEEKISRLENFRDDPIFNERERIAIEFAETHGDQSHLDR